MQPTSDHRRVAQSMRGRYGIHEAIRAAEQAATGDMRGIVTDHSSEFFVGVAAALRQLKDD